MNTKTKITKTLKAVNELCRQFTWCDNYATKELKTIFSALSENDIDYMCIEDKYFWYNDIPTTKEQIYRLSYHDEIIEHILVIHRYYGISDSDRCELLAYVS